MKAIQGYHVIKPEDLHWRPSNLMKIPNSDYLERTGSENLGARLWRLPPKSANTLHKHIRSEEFYFVLEGTGRMRVGDETLTVPQHGGVLVAPDQLRQVLTIPMTTCCGSSSADRRNWNFCKVRNPRSIFR
jgi:mannose-6-phosphate isomerase-like protein (cupin superfamily)